MCSTIRGCRWTSSCSPPSAPATRKTTLIAEPGAEGGAGEAERPPAGGSEYAICVATFYEDLAERLVNSATEAFAERGVSPASVHVFEVPGAFELPLAAKLCAESGRFAGVACVGAVIRGETSHYDHVCGEAARGIQDVGLRTGVPCAFGLITSDTREQAEARAGGEKRDQGRSAAEAVLRMAELSTALSREQGAGSREE